MSWAWPAAGLLLLQAAVPSTSPWLSEERRIAALAPSNVVERYRAAIKAGATGKELAAIKASGLAERSWGNVHFGTPYARLQAVAKKRRELYKEITPGVIAAVWTPTLEIYARPDPPAKITSPVVSVKHIVVITPAGPLQPTSLREMPEARANLFGARVEWSGLTATFPLDVLKEGNTIRIILDRAVLVLAGDFTGPMEDAEGNYVKSKDDPVPITAELLARLK